MFRLPSVCSSTDRASDYGSEGWGFESLQAHTIFVRLRKDRDEWFNMATLSAHQPNFLPWVPFFEKARDSDVFVILQNAQFVKGNYHNRFNLDSNWYTMSVSKGITPLCDKAYAKPQEDWNRINNRLPKFKTQLRKFEEFISTDLVSTNFSIILKSMELLGGKWPLVELEPKTGLSGTDRLVEICKLYGADTYLSGPSGARYLDAWKFEEQGIRLEFASSSKLSTPLLKALDDSDL